MDTVLLVVVPYPDPKVTDEAVQTEPILLVWVQREGNEVLPRITESQLPNTGARPSEVTEFLFLFGLRICQKAPLTVSGGLEVGQLVDRSIAFDCDFHDEIQRYDTLSSRGAGQVTWRVTILPPPPPP
ncbi:MAG: hypothetical protein HDT21_03645 [Ruminococcus sp.]|nr:hypothetical protein [Ruminococcus sp.]